MEGRSLCYSQNIPQAEAYPVERPYYRQFGMLGPTHRGKVGNNDTKASFEKVSDMRSIPESIVAETLHQSLLRVGTYHEPSSGRALDLFRPQPSPPMAHPASQTQYRRPIFLPA